MHEIIVIEAALAQPISIQLVVPFLPDHVRGVVIFFNYPVKFDQGPKGVPAFKQDWQSNSPVKPDFFTIMAMIVFYNHK